MLVLSACGRKPETDFSALFADAKSKYDAGDFSAALEKTRKGVIEASSSGTWAQKFKSLQTEVLFADASKKFDHGELDLAAQEAKEGFDQTTGDLLWNYKFRVLLAEIFLWKGDFDRTLSLLNDPPSQELATGEFAIRRKIAQGTAYLPSRQLEKAQQSLTEAERLARTSASEWTGEVMLSWGNYSLKKPDVASAERYFQEALRLARQLKKRSLEIKALGSMSVVNQDKGRYEEAIDWIKDSLQLARSEQAPGLVAISLANIGSAYLQIGDFERANAYFSEAEKVSAGKSGDETLFGEIGNTYFAEEKYDEAREYFLKALALAVDTKETLAQAIDQDRLAQVALQQHKLPEAKKYTEQSLAFDPKRPQFILTSASIARSEGRFDKCEVLLRQILGTKGIEESVEWEVNAELANMYVERGKTGKAEDEFKKLLQTLDSARSSIYEPENKLAFSSRMVRFYDQYIHFLIKQGQTVKALEMADFIHGRTLLESLDLAQGAMHLGLQDVHAVVRKRKQVALVYWLGSESSFVFVITPSTVEFRELPPRREIESSVDAYNKALLGSRDLRHSATRIGEQLYRILVEPLQPLLASHKSVLIVPDRGLYKLNFETLLVPGLAGHYWIRDVEIENASSIMLLARGRSDQHQGRQELLLFGNPLSPSNEFPPLNHAEEEIQRIAGLFPSSEEKIVSEKDATTAAYLTRVHEQYRYVHFVTHGEASLLGPLESALILTRDGDTYKLYARDIIKARIHADLVTISACFGAGTRTYSGEGLVGLAWAFMNAGAHQVIAGLWEVDDAATPDLMQRFYEEMRGGANAGAALRLAKLHLLDSDSVYKRPYYWASLQLYTGS